MSIITSTLLFIALCLVWLIGTITQCNYPSIPIRRQVDTLADYLEWYNPLIDYYNSIPMTSSDIQFINKIHNPSISLTSVDGLSGIMLMKIYFKRAELKHILSKTEYDKLIMRASDAYAMYTQMMKNHSYMAFVPDMYGHRDIVKKDLSSYFTSTISFNELFYFNACDIK